MQSNTELKATGENLAELYDRGKRCAVGQINEAGEEEGTGSQGQKKRNSKLEKRRKLEWGKEKEGRKWR